MKTSRRCSVSFALAALLMAGCGTPGEPSRRAPGGEPVARSKADIHSHARPDLVRVTHMQMDWTVLFEERALDGHVILHLDRAQIAPGAADEPLRLDTRDLEISSVSNGRSRGGQGAAGMTPGEWRLAEPDEILGSELVVELPAGADLVRIDYRTKPGATGLQWLAPVQTAAGRFSTASRRPSTPDPGSPARTARRYG